MSSDAAASPAHYEKLGAFYLGRRWDPARGAATAEPILYDAKDLTTHAVCVGMTGSGKTGLGITLLEEAAIDGIPIVAIDPKGDLGNLLLTFPDLTPADFAPWVDAQAAARAGQTPAQHAATVAQTWRHGLAEWGQAPDRIARFAAAAERRILTPGSAAGIPVNILGSLAPPPEAVRDQPEAFRDRILAVVSGLLGLLGRPADPLQSREHILLANLFERAWRAGRALDLATLIRQIQRPPLERIGVLDLESFFPDSARQVFALAINNLLAAPGFELWMQGDPLDARGLLFAPDGRPRLSIVSIAHLSDPERMFVVTQVLGELVSWMRTRPGATTLRALLYMDEVFGYLPPTANPPSKQPLLTLLKQARAFGLGTVLATQNPVDLDYKALGNAGTWFLGRLQTERDKARVLDGLEGSAVGAFNRDRLDATLSGLGSRVFLMNNVHEDEPVLFHTRWALSYLAGPLTREQIAKLAAAPPRPPAPHPPAEARASQPGEGAVADTRPALPARVTERFLPTTLRPAPGQTLEYRPALAAATRAHYVYRGSGLDHWARRAWFVPLPGAVWDDARILGEAIPELEREPEAGARFVSLPPDAARVASYARWQRGLRQHVYRSARIQLYRSHRPKRVSVLDESEAEFRGRVREALREERDRAVEKLRKRFAPRLAQLRRRIERAEQRLTLEQEQYRERKFSAAVSIGATLLGALFGRKAASAGTVGRATTAARGIGRAASERGDIERAKANIDSAERELEELEERLRAEIATLEFEPDAAEIEPISVAPRKSDIEAEVPVLVWCPWLVGSDGRCEPAWADGAWPEGARSAGVGLPGGWADGRRTNGLGE